MHRRLSLILSIAFMLAPTVVTAEQGLPHILVINSYNTEYRWTADQYSGIMEALEGLKQEYVVYTEYLDWKRFPEEAHIDLVLDLCREKYSGKDIDVIITTDDRALQFAMDNRAGLFSDAPVVFSGVYRDAADRLTSGRTNVTGVYEDLDIANTMKYAELIQGGIEHVYLINEVTESGLGTERLMIEAARRELPDAEIHTLSYKPIEEIEKFVRTLAPRSMLLVGSFFI